MGYQVGQVIYLVSKKDTRIFPARVIEQISRRTLAGEEESYIIELPDKKSSRVPLENIDAEIFVSLDLLKTHLLNEATATIDRVVENAAVVQKQVFKSEATIQDSALQDAADSVEIDIGDGVKARVNLETLGDVKIAE